MEYDFAKIEKKWQARWEKEKIFEVDENPKKKKFYVLEMFPYPSADGLHMGHALNYAIGDVFARFKIMNGFNVLHPMGYDALGLPAENAAIKVGTHPKDYTEKAIKNYIRQQKSLGLSYDWSRIVSTADSNYYKWDQWIFLKMFEKGLAYKKISSVNWCPKCNTVLANEQAQSGKCERCESEVEIKNLNQWFFKITDYAEELLDGHRHLEWPQKTIAMQKNWIGKSHGTEIDFEISTNSNFILLHKCTGGPENFFPWLKKELEEKGYNVNVPQLSNTDGPNINKQVEFVLKNCKFDENTILLSHSLAGVVALKVLEKLDKPIKKLILVAGFAQPGFKDKKRPYEDKFDWKFDFNKIKNNVKEILILRAKNDSVVFSERADFLKEKLEGKIINFTAEKDHVTAEKEPFVLENCFEKWKIFTTRPDTIFGVTFMVVSAQHEKLFDLVTPQQKKEVEKFLKKLKSVSEKELESMEKEGVFTGSYAINPLTKEKIPVYAGNFVVADYGSGMVMAVPAHDQRDFEFAKKYKIKIKQVIDGKITGTRAFTGEGKLINSEKFNGIENKKAIEEITKFLSEKNLGRKTFHFKLKDWCISRQRYWGTPIPIINCEKCGIVVVPEKDLPVKLPEKVKFGKGNPLETNEEWINVKCPKCGAKARRETDTMDTFVNSSWYFLRYCDPKNNEKIFDSKKANYWCPIDMYIGGAEHACMHLIFFRFYTKFLHKLGLINFDEPAKKLFHQGMLHGEGGIKMSKSKGNVINPDEVSKKYGIDTARFFLLSLAAPDKPRDWNEEGIKGSLKFIKKIFEYFETVKIGKSNPKTESKLNSVVKDVTNQIETFQYNLAIIKIRELFSVFSKEESREVLEKFLKLLLPFCPHVAEELWEKLGNENFISLEKWPISDDKKINLTFDIQEKAVEKLIEDINNVGKIVEEKTGKKKSKVFVYVLPNELENYSSNFELIKKKINFEIKIFAVNDKNKYDPENKSGKVKVGRPGIYLE